MLSASPNGVSQALSHVPEDFRDLVSAAVTRADGKSIAEQARDLSAKFDAGELGPGEGVLVNELGELFSFDPLPVDEFGAAIMPGEDDLPSVPGTTSFDLADTFLLHSNPGATKTLLLDFDGHTTLSPSWNGGVEFTTPRFNFEGYDTSFTDGEYLRIQAIWERVAEDFAAFDVDVTTEEPASIDLLERDWGDPSDEHWGQRVVIGGHSSDWLGGSYSGYAMIGSFWSSSDNPTFVFSENLSGNEVKTALIVSHEAGHTLGLSHDGTTSSTYYGGYGTGETSWGPIMGAPWDRSLTQWSKGEYANASSTQDDLAIITGSNNGINYRTDDHGDDTASASALTIQPDASVFDSGLVGQTNDIDSFSFTTRAGTVNLDINPFYRGANLDVLATLYDSGGTVIATSNPVDGIAASFSESLAAGTYYLSVEGTGRVDPSGYSDYASLGQYTITGNILTPAVKLTETAGDTFVSEGKTTDTYDVALVTTPAGSVEITATADAQTELSLDGVNFSSAVVFSRTDTTAQTITVRAIDDAVVDVLDTSTITHAITATNDVTDYPTSLEIFELGLDVQDDEAVHIMDDDDIERRFTHTNFTYEPSPYNAGYETDYHSNTAGTGSAEARWTFSDLSTGTYSVAVTWRELGSRATDAPYSITNGSGLVFSTSTIDQTAAPVDFTDAGGTWDDLGMVTITNGTLSVTLNESPGATGKVVADAVRIVKTGTVQLESLSVAVVASSIAEADGAAATTGTVSRTGDLTGDLVVTLASDDTSEATVPATVTILDGQASATFDIDAVDDPDFDGTQTVTISAAAINMHDGSDTLDVTSDDVLIEIIDDGETGFTQTGFSYRNDGQTAAAYNGDNYNMTGGSGEATWTFSNLPDGKYQVSATWAHKYSNNYNTLDAPFSVEDGSQNVLATATIDQSNVPSEFADGGYNWDTLGTVDITGGTLVTILGAGSHSGKDTVADAIRIERIGDVSAALTVSIVADEVAELDGAAATTGTVTRDGDLTGDLVVTLTSDDTSEATVPATVTILDGQASATFDIAAVDDSEADGTQTATITATATGMSGGSDTVDVTDDEEGMIAVMDDGEAGFSQTGFVYQNNSLVAAAYNADNYNLWGTGPGEASWTFTGLPDGKFQVAATWAHKYSNNYNAEDAPFTIENGAQTELAAVIVDQSNVPSEFAYNGFNWDTLASVNVTDGTLTITLGAGSFSSAYSVADAIRIERTGDVSAALTVSIADDSVSETDGAAATTATVSRVGDTTGDLVVTLTSDNTAEATVPATVTILDGQASATFDIAAVDDSLADGDQTVTITAAASGFPDGSDTLDVTDDEADLVTVMDDGDAGFTETGFSHLDNSTVAHAYNGDNYNMQGGTGEAVWTFTSLADGEYKVAATWANKYNNNYGTKDAPFSVENGSQAVLATATFDQSLEPAEFAYDGYYWETIGTVNVIDGTLVVKLGAGSNSGLFSVADAIRIEKLGEVSTALIVSIADNTIAETDGAAATTGTVTRTGSLAGDLVVTLTSDDTSEITAPATVTILDGQSSATFDIAAIDDTTADGIQTVTLTAAATGYDDASDTVDVTDDEANLVTIMDDGDAGFTETGFDHLSNSQVSHAYNGDNYNMQGGTGEAVWTFTGLADGEYHVSATWANKYNNNYGTKDAPFAVENSSQTVLATATFDQSLEPGEFAYDGYYWETIGTVSITGGTLAVTLGAGSNSGLFSVADAIRIERILGGAGPALIPEGDSSDDSVAPQGSGHRGPSHDHVFAEMGGRSWRGRSRSLGHFGDSDDDKDDFFSRF